VSFERHLTFHHRPILFEGGGAFLIVVVVVVVVDFGYFWVWYLSLFYLIFTGLCGS